ncbi:hypothetical protein BIW11_04223 [Tropilaelaps mercedesae]|uniref:Uncharacterized protein n=1 Tax=Tropilaelaps mercedesae TaxID=418985 RepID=A0A1V9X9L8_9ACAR|nr:hypothetical protein BIW11_04223 [Tropilaelaps mercedesae]
MRCEYYLMLKMRRETTSSAPTSLKPMASSQTVLFLMIGIVLTSVTGVAAEAAGGFDALLLVIGVAVIITISCGCLGVYARSHNAI